MAKTQRLPALIGTCLSKVTLKAFRPGCTLRMQEKLKAFPSLFRRSTFFSTSSHLRSGEVTRLLSIATLHSRHALFSAVAISTLVPTAAAECERPEIGHNVGNKSWLSPASALIANETSRHDDKKIEKNPPNDGLSTPSSDFASLFAGGLILTYTAVYSMWRTLIYLEDEKPGSKLVRSLQTLVKRYFICILDELRRGRLCTLIFSAVSHNKITHLLANAAGTWLLIRWDSEYASPFDLVALFWGGALFANVFTALMSLLYTVKSGISWMGASGGLYSLLVFNNCARRPEGIEFSVFGKTYDSLDAGLRLFLLIEAFYSLLSRWRTWKASVYVSVRGVSFDSHLGGALFGLMYHRLVFRKEDDDGN